MKQSPKSCSCRSCKYGKTTGHGNYAMKHDERKFRHASKIALNKGKEDLTPAPVGNYYD